MAQVIGEPIDIRVKRNSPFPRNRSLSKDAAIKLKNEEEQRRRAFESSSRSFYPWNIRAKTATLQHFCCGFAQVSGRGMKTLRVTCESPIF
jgi:hypothetical protein